MKSAEILRTFAENMAPFSSPIILMRTPHCSSEVLIKELKIRSFALMEIALIAPTLTLLYASIKGGQPAPGLLGAAVYLIGKTALGKAAREMKKDYALSLSNQESSSLRQRSIE